MKKHMKFTSMLLALALTVAILPTAAFAAEKQGLDNNELSCVVLNLKGLDYLLSEDSVQVTSQHLQKVNDDLEILWDLGIVMNEQQIEEIDIKENGKVTYLVKMVTNDDLISVNDLDKGIEIVVQEGEITNILTLCNDGNIFLDGELIQSMTGLYSAESIIAPHSTDYWQENTPYYGTSADYKYAFNKNDSFPDLNLNRALNSISDAVAIGLLTSLLTAGGGIIAAAGAGIAGSIAGGVIGYARANDPFTSAFSYKATSYTINSGTGYINANYGYQYQYRFTFYTRQNYGGTSYKETWYHMNLPYVG